MTSGFSGFMLSTSVSIGIAGGDGGNVLSAVFSSGWRMGIFELGGRNASGYFSSGTGVPTGIGDTTSGVTSTMSSVSFLVLDEDWNNLPMIGMSPRNGNFENVSVRLLSSRPPMMKVSPSFSSTSVFTLRVVRPGTSNPEI